MNYVTTTVTQPTQSHFTVDDLGEGKRHTAFVGQVGGGPAHSLYLITYQGVVLAGKPGSTWSGRTNITVDRFCDVDITERS